MFVPPHFAQTDLVTLHDFIERHSFGLFVSHIEGEPFASHLPFLLDRTSGPCGTLIGHFARANPQWKEAAKQTSLAVFPGPHAYISPTWYEAENTVPTWNYAAVHAYGTAVLVEDKPGLLAILTRSAAKYESTRPRPWTIDESSTFTDRLLGQIVGFRIEIGRIEGKWKLNQNHPVERRKKVIAALRKEGGENAVGVAELMRQTLGPTDLI